MDPTFGYDELFAFRVMLQDDFENESDIIRELRYELLQRGMPQNDIPNFLKNFYEKYGINISLNTINESLNTENQMPLQNVNDFMHLLNGFLNQNLMPPNPASGNQTNLENNQANIENNQANIENNQANIENNQTNVDEDNQTNVDEDNQTNVDEDNQTNVDEDNDEDLLEDDDQDLVDDDNELPPLEPMNNLMSSVILTLNANGIQTSLPPIPIHSNHTPQQLENLINNFINQQDYIFSSPMLFNPIIAPLNNLQDVAVTLNEEELKNLKKYKSNKTLEENCSICMLKMGENPEEELCKLPCEHDFHVECIEPYLENYNYKCPICRKEVGKPKYDI